MDFAEPRRPITASFIGGRGHYEQVVRAVMDAQRSVWIATANLKELMVEDHRAAPGRRRTIRAGKGAAAYRSILAVFDELSSRGVELRILHASPPSGPFRRELARHPRLARPLVTAAREVAGQGVAAPKAAVARRADPPLALRACPRVHFKAVVVDGAYLYLGSANWTGAGLGAKGKGRRNFELGFSTSDDLLLDRVQELYERVWRGAECAGCKLREVCPAPLDAPPRGRASPLDAAKSAAPRARARPRRAP